MKILAIDQGTTSTRALAIDDSGEARIVKAIRHQQYYPQPGWVEHDPEELINNIQLCIDSCDDPQIIGIDNQGESCLAWNADTKQAICPVIVWQDNRTEGYIEQLLSDNAEELILERAGLPLDTYFSASKFSWILNNVPEAPNLLKKGLLRMGTTDAFFLDRLADRFVTDISTASRTSLMNLNTGRWDEDLCKLFGVPITVLPEIVPTTGCFGTISSNEKDIPVRASVVDQQAALYGHGCTTTGDAKITFGTGAFALVQTGDTPYHSAAQGLLPTVAWQKNGQKPVYALDGGVFSAASSINWAKSLGLFSSYDQIHGFQDKNRSAIERDLVFVPALTGLGSPHWDRKAGGLWLGLSLDTGAMDLIQSILEGIVFRTAEVLNAINDLVTITRTISIDGGLSANPYFCQFLADVLHMQITVKSTAELTALGAAKLAAGERLNNIKEESSQHYEPKSDKRQYLDRYQDAVARSMKWKS